MNRDKTMLEKQIMHSKTYASCRRLTAPKVRRKRLKKKVAQNWYTVWYYGKHGVIRFDRMITDEERDILRRGIIDRLKNIELV